MFLWRSVSAIYVSHARFELKQKECSDRIPEPLELGLRLAERHDKHMSHHTQVATVKHIVAIFMHIVTHEFVLLHPF